MKKLALSSLLLLLGTLVWAQASNDRRGYQGTVTAAVMQTVRHEGTNVTKEETKGNTDIVFSARNIVIGDDSYDIVKKEFDGKNTTTFTCTKRRGTFEIKYAVGDSITITDTSNPDEELVYQSLTQK